MSCKLEPLWEKARRYVQRKFVRQRKMSKAELERDRVAYMQANTDSRFAMDRKYDYICIGDKYAQNGSFDNQYFIQDIWGARKVFEHKPEIHYDVGSSVVGFVAHLLSMKQKIKLIDIRPMQNDLDTRFLRSGGGHHLLSVRRHAFR